MARRSDTACKIFIDMLARVQAGDFIATPAGSGYFVLAVRLPTARTLDPVRRRVRQFVTCVRMPASEIPPGSTIHTIRWYPRKRRR